MTVDLFKRLAEHFQPEDQILRDMLSISYKQKPLLKSDILRMQNEDWELECAFEHEYNYYFHIGIGEDEQVRELKVNECKIANAIYDLGFSSDVRRKKHGYEVYVSYDRVENGEHVQDESFAPVEDFFDVLSIDKLTNILRQILKL